MSTTASNPSLTEKISEILSRDPGQMLPVVAKMLQVPEAEVLRHHPGDVSVELDPTKIEQIIYALERLGRVHVICRNDECVLETYGTFGGFSIQGIFLNVQNDSLDMHIVYKKITQAFALIKPSHQDGQTTYSVQFFNEAGRSVFKAFLYKTVTEAAGDEIEARINSWKGLVDEFRLSK